VLPSRVKGAPSVSAGPGLLSDARYETGTWECDRTGLAATPDRPNPSELQAIYIQPSPTVLSLRGLLRSRSQVRILVGA